MQISNLRRILKWSAIALAATVAVAAPTNHLIDSSGKLTEKLDLKATFLAQDISRHIYLNGEHWKYQINRLNTLIEVPDQLRDINRVRIVDPAGTVIVEQGPAIEWPLRTRSLPIFVKEAQVASIEIDMSLRPLLAATGLYAIFGIVIGFLIYFSIRIIPHGFQCAIDAKDIFPSRLICRKRLEHRTAEST